MESKIVSRGMGRSVVAASAYMSCSRLYNDYDGIQHDYTRKQGLIWQDVFLPPQAPQEWRDREQLWNAVEAAEKTKDSRLAREIIVALPVELEPDEQIALTSACSYKLIADGEEKENINGSVSPIAENGTYEIGMRFNLPASTEHITLRPVRRISGVVVDGSEDIVLR